MSTLATTHGSLELAGRAGKATARDVLGSLVARLVASVRQYRQDRLYEQLMRDDPRVFADFQAAVTRADSR